MSFKTQQNMKVPERRQQALRCNLKRVAMQVGYRSHDVTGSGIDLGAALDGLRD
ncbi:MAG: hypothetical protein R6V41_11525 [Desulfobacteraceae bacterium]